MKLGMVGLGRMGANMAERLLGAGHEVVAFDRHPEKVDALTKKGAAGAGSLDELVRRLEHQLVLENGCPAKAVAA